MQSISLEELCRTTWQDLYRFVYWKVQNRQEAEEITQETYARLLAARPNLEQGQLGGLLRTIALNIIRDNWRRQQTRGPLVSLQDVPEPMAEDSTVSHVAITSALDALPADQREIVVMRIVQGFSIRETAKRLNITEAAVKNRQYRALKRLSELLGGHNDA